MPEQYGEDDYGSGVFGGGTLEPTINRSVFFYLPEILPRSLERVLDQYVDSHDVEFDGYDGALSYTELSRQVKNAEGRDLDRIGRLFGPLGARGTRDREEYRTFLENLITSFNARGTVSGLKFAIASAANTSTDNVTINEDFADNEYEISIVEADTNFISSAINQLAELADPSAVKLAAAPVLIITGDEVVLDSTESSVIETTTGLGAETLSLDGSQSLQ